MPDVSIAVSIRNNYSRSMKQMASDTKAFDKDIEMLVRDIKDLNQSEVEIKTRLSKAKEELREAQKGLDDTAEAAERLEKAQLNVNFLTEELRDISKAGKQARKDLVDLDTQVSKSRNSGSLDGKSEGIISRLGNAGALQMAGDLFGQVAGTYVSSAYGAQAGTMFGSVLSGAGSGAAIGTMIGGPGIGTAVGAGVGALAGAVSGATTIYSEQDDAFKSYVQGQVEEQLNQREETRERGSSIAAKREIDQLSFTTMFNKNAELAERYLGDVRNMANDTPFEYDDLVSLSKTLKAYGFEVGHMIPTLTKIGDAGATLGMGVEDMNAIATALGRMYVGGSATREDLDILSDRAINSVQYLADAYGVEYSEMLEKISKGEVEGKQAVEIILTGMQEDYSGGMELQGQTFEGLTSSLEDAYAEMENAQGEAFNNTLKPGLEKQLEFLNGETGEKMQEMYAQMGTLQADLQNMQEQMYRDIMNGMFTGDIAAGMDEEIVAQVQAMHDRYTEAMATLDSTDATTEEQIAARAELAALLGETQALAENQYYESEAVTILTEANKTMAANIASGAVEAYKNAGEAMGQQLTQGIQAALSRFRPSVNIPSASTYVTGPTATASTGRASTYLTGGPAAFGIDRVPYDDYPALLHEGERVLTANQARQADAAGAGGVTIHVHGMTVREDADITRIAGELLSELKIAMAARKS